MSQAEVERRLELAAVYLRDSQTRGLSLRARFGAAYDAARACSLAFAGTANLPIVYGEGGHHETFGYLIEALALGAEAAQMTDQMIRRHHLESRLLYEGRTAISGQIMSDATHWAKHLVQVATAAIRERSARDAC